MPISARARPSNALNTSTLAPPRMTTDAPARPNSKLDGAAPRVPAPGAMDTLERAPAPSAFEVGGAAALFGQPAPAIELPTSSRAAGLTQQAAPGDNAQDAMNDLISGAAGVGGSVAGTASAFGTKVSVAELLGAGTACEVLTVGALAAAAFAGGYAIGVGVTKLAPGLKKIGDGIADATDADGAQQAHQDGVDARSFKEYTDAMAKLDAKDGTMVDGKPEESPTTMLACPNPINEGGAIVGPGGLLPSWTQGTQWNPSRMPGRSGRDRAPVTNPSPDAPDTETTDATRRWQNGGLVDPTETRSGVLPLEARAIAAAARGPIRPDAIDPSPDAEETPGKKRP